MECNGKIGVGERANRMQKATLGWLSNTQAKEIPGFAFSIGRRFVDIYGRRRARSSASGADEP